MPNSIARETELRRAVIDRLIAASLKDGTPARETTLQRWRSLTSNRSEATGSSDTGAV
jgi:hypothetical protein